MSSTTGYSKANSENLPKVDAAMVVDFMKKFQNAEPLKENLLSKNTDSDSSIGYVCLRRDDHHCYLHARMIPGNEITVIPYTVSMIIDEKGKKVVSVTCKDCGITSSGCTHAIKFLMWTCRKSQEPSSNQITCYWNKPTITNSGKSIKVAVLSDNKNNNKQQGNKTTVKVKSWSTSKKTTILKNQTSIRNYFSPKGVQSTVVTCTSKSQTVVRNLFTSVDVKQPKNLSVHKLITDFLRTGKSTAEEFLEFSKTIITEAVCEEIERLTRSQSNDDLWHLLRKGRITASKIHEVTHCRSLNVNLINGLLGIKKAFLTEEMSRGIDLEDSILEAVKRKHNLKFGKCGLMLLPSCPVIGASPDGLGDDFIVEVKAPSSMSGYDRFLPKGEISKKCANQMYLQMLCTKRRKGIFCVADPNFEINNKVTTIWLQYDEQFSNVVQKATTFWIDGVFPRLMNYK